VRVRKGATAAAAKLPQGAAATLRRKENSATVAVQKVAATIATVDDGSVPFQFSTFFTSAPNGGF
jgi:hypothetical protein